MAYINGYDYDIFISYAHLDNQIIFQESLGWIEEFYKELKLLLARRIGIADAVKVWWDNKKLDGSMVFDSYIDDSIQRSAIIICLISPAYLHSQYCKKELQSFYEKALLEPEKLHLNNRSRIINVLMNNIPYSYWPKELSGTTGFKFNDAKENDDLGDPFEMHSAEFRNGLKGLRDAVIKLMEEFKNRQQVQPVLTNKFTIFFGDVSDSLRQLKKRTIAELKAQDFEVISDVPPPYESPEHENAVREKLSRSNLSVHLLDQYPGREIEGEENVWYPQTQTEVCMESPQPQLIWTPLDMSYNDVEEDNYKHFLQNLESGGAMPEKNIKFIRGLKSELTQQIADVAARLQIEQRKPKERISILLDTHYDDQLFALELSRQLIENGIQPYINPEEDDPKKNITILEDRISQVSKLVFFYGKVSHYWISERINAAMQLIVTNRYPRKEFYVYMLPPHKNQKEISDFDSWLVPINVIDNSDTMHVSSERLQQFFKSIKVNA